MLLLTKTQPPILYVRTIYDHPRYVDRLFRDWYDITQLPKNDLKVTVNFNYCEFLGHIGVAFLGGMVRLLEAHGGNVTFDWNTLTDKKIRTNLAQNGFLCDFGYNWEPWDGNSIPFKSDRQHDPIAIADYLQYKWLGKGWVNISPRLQEAITGKVVEIYLNAFEHSQPAIGVFSCGQNYPEAGMLQLTVIDFGIGIPNRVRTLPENSTMTATEALEWAFQPGNSTKQNGVRQGEGLHLLQEFVKKNHGNLMIFSNDGYVTIGDNGIIHENKCTSFSGTLVNIALRCDESYYCLASEVPQLRKQIF